jgi:hypothetical protein
MNGQRGHRRRTEEMNLSGMSGQDGSDQILCYFLSDTTSR